MKKRNTLFLIFFLLFFLSFFHRFFVVANYISMGALILLALTDDPIRQKMQLLKERKYIWFMLAFFALLIISFLFSANKHDGLQYLLRRAPLLLFPLGLGLVAFTRQFRDRVLLGLAIIVSIACLVSLGWAIYQYSLFNNTGLLYNDSLSDFIHQQSIYTSVFVNISIYVFVYFIVYYRVPNKQKLLLILGIVFLLAISYLLASRNMMLILYTTSFIFAIYIVLKRKKYKEGILLLTGVLIAGAAIFIFFPKTINRFRELTYTQFNYESTGRESHYNMELTPDQWNGANFRLAAWQCGWQLFKKHPVAGVGLGDKKDELFKTYTEKNFRFAINTQKNVHNNYLDILIGTGVIGLILFLAGWVVLPCIRIIHDQDGLAFLVLLTLLFAMITENYFDRSIGAMLFGFFVPFLLTSCKKNPSAGR